MKLKLIFSILLLALLNACSSQPVQQATHFDMQAVNEYDAKVSSGNTVPANQRKAPQVVDNPVNQSDYRIKEMRNRPNVVLIPTISYGYGHWHH